MKSAVLGVKSCRYGSNIGVESPDTENIDRQDVVRS